MSGKLIYRKHAIMRMFERGISEEDIRETLRSGEIIADYQDDKPYPSQLLLGWIDNKPMHVLTAKTDNDETIIVTAYLPEHALWEDNFRRRRL
jgi:hypothetical protein